MPSLRIVSWNSTGEDAARVVALAAVQPALALMFPAHPNVDVYLIQEAWLAPGGPIDVWLNALVGYTVTHISEQVPGGFGAHGYICATRNASVLVNAPLQLWNYGADPTYFAWVPPGGYNGLLVAGPGSRPPAPIVFTEITSGNPVLLSTWHAPIGPSMIPIIVGGMPGGGALLDAYLALDHSELVLNPQNAVQTLTGAPFPVMPALTIIAGDMNTNAAGLAGPYPPVPPPGPYVPLNNYQGYGNNLDHILASQVPGGVLVNVAQGQNTPAPGTHNIISALVSW